ncbi:hypothetical protein BCR42DRAFT_412947 [Absidia repens]|uniref:CBS domain-containing protein n=1 Tax=Absidia repens TaxID=90262 RepID=A0A1X2IKD0_9FUNG|nr:hypothetical protein BCR42DRAFT_412947 [Absidia repens]
MTTLHQQIASLQSLGVQRNSSIHPQSFIATKTIADVLAKVKPTLSNRELVDLPMTATVDEALNTLLTEDILSVPVVLDLLKLWSPHTADTSNSNFFHRQIKDAIGQTEESSTLVTVQYSDALVDVLHLFTEHGAHRVLVTSKENQQEQPPVFISQMDIMRYLQAHNHHMGAILDKTVPDLIQQSPKRRQKRRHLGQQKEKLVSVTFKTTALKAFEQLAHDHPFINALPILDDEDYLVGDISPKDLRTLNKARLNDLSKPVLMFLKSNRGDDNIAPMTCHHRFTLSQIMAAFVLRKASRLWWVDQDGHVLGVITLTDVLGYFLDDSYDF